MIIFVKYRRVLLADNSLNPNYSNYLLCMHSTSWVFLKQFYDKYIYVILGYFVVPAPPPPLEILPGYAFSRPFRSYCVTYLIQTLNVFRYLIIPV